jgi:hypothetical protein
MPNTLTHTFTFAPDQDDTPHGDLYFSPDRREAMYEEAVNRLFRAYVSYSEARYA